ncbi:MAG: 23S rRNA (adenine(2503)-C(2))-methyltransferase RlmN [Pseudomonadota bacterium]
MLPAITDIALHSLKKAVVDLGLKPYAATQLVQWLYSKRAKSFDDVTDVSKEGRKLLKERYEISAVEIVGEQKASDGTLKLLCKAHDGKCVECVLIPALDGRTTACLSTQVGCAMKCAFCRTASMGFVRNLTLGEITGQLILLARASSTPITNVVFMGMGEPLANMEAVENAIAVFRNEKAFGLSKRRITVSTCGLIPELKKFCERNDVKAAISLNATTDDVRTKLMPINKQWPIAKIMNFSREYSKRSRYRVTFEYVMIKGMNDSEDDAKRLIKLLHGVRAKVNLIPFNSYESSKFKAPLENTLDWWSDFLREKGIQVNIRASRGQEILAACGQLAAKC